jgi:hypothetical protein
MNTTLNCTTETTMSVTAFLIDPFKRHVHEVKLNSHARGQRALRAVYHLLDCQRIEMLRPLNAGTDALYVDEMGRFREEPAAFFCRLWPGGPIVGRALWIGTSSDGSTASPQMTLRYVRDHIVWL